MTIQDIPNASAAGFTTTAEVPVIIKVLGVGGGGQNAVSHMFRQDIKHVSFAVLNTDNKALMQSPVPTKVQIGSGLGAGNKPEVARGFAEESAEEIAAIFNDDTKMVFITAGMGGGTGTGASPVVARIAREKGLLTIGIVTIPFLFEGTKKIIKAIEGAEEMSKYVDAMLIINNQRLNEIYPDLNVINAFGKADDTLTTAARSIAEIITWETVQIRLDFNDVDTTLRNGGPAIISSGYGEGDHRVSKAIQDALRSPLLKNRDVLSSKKLLFVLFINPADDFRMDETDELTSFISSIDAGVDVIWGLYYDASLEHRVKITILASGFDTSVNTPVKSGGLFGEKVIGFDQQRATSDIDTERIRQEYGDKAVAHINEQQAKARFIVLTPSQMDDDRFIEAFEKSPTHNRNTNVANEIREISSRGVNPGALAGALAGGAMRQPSPASAANPADAPASTATSTPAAPSPAAPTTPTIRFRF